MRRNPARWRGLPAIELLRPATLQHAIWNRRRSRVATTVRCLRSYPAILTNCGQHNYINTAPATRGVKSRSTTVKIRKTIPAMEFDTQRSCDDGVRDWLDADRQYRRIG